VKNVVEGVEMTKNPFLLFQEVEMIHRLLEYALYCFVLFCVFFVLPLRGYENLRDIVYHLKDFYMVKEEHKHQRAEMKLLHKTGVLPYYIGDSNHSLKLYYVHPTTVNHLKLNILFVVYFRVCSET
jgi:hypothetical protein